MIDFTRIGFLSLSALMALHGVSPRTTGAQENALEYQPDGLPAVRWHLTARPWRPLEVPPERYLEVIEGVCRFSVRHQDGRGAIIDPFLKREHQYATPYFAYAVGTLVSAGRAKDLLPYGVLAMDRSTADFASGRKAIPDEHGEFFIPALTGALELYRRHVPPQQWTLWRQRLTKPLDQVVRGAVNNWETYAMKGQWMRALAGLADRAEAVAFIEEAWASRQRGRIADTPWRLYHDRSSDPDTLNVEAVGRGNLLALVEHGYDGPSAREIRDAVESGSRMALLLQDPSGQTPTNGRTDDHVWVDVGYQLIFEVMAERCLAQGDTVQAGRFRRAALLAFTNIGRWRRTDGPWNGSFFVTKNHFDPALRVGHQNASQYSNYNGSLMFHLSEAFQARKSDVAQQPAPSEIGGYALATDRQFASVFANAGGMMIQANLRGDTAPTNGNFWTPLGLVRFARVGWDTRLGPSDGARTESAGASFAPTFRDGDTWVHLADQGGRYEGLWSVQFAHPLLVRCAIDYRPRTGQHGPSFRQEFVVTPDGVLSSLGKTSDEAIEWGVTWPLLENDGAPLVRTTTSHIAAVSYPGQGDEQNFIALHEQPALALNEPLVRSTYGDLRPVRVRVPEAINRTFVYPRTADDPPAESVRQSFRLTDTGFESVLGRVDGNQYIGRTAAGGQGDRIDLDGDGQADVRFSQACAFVLQLAQGRVLAVEADREVTANLEGRQLRLQPYSPATALSDK